MTMMQVATTCGRVVAIATVVIAAGGFGRVDGQGGGGRTFVSPGGTELEVLVEAASLGGSEVVT